MAGVARNRVIGHSPGGGSDRKPPWRDVENEGDGHRGPAKPAPVPSGDDLSGLQWDMQMIGATPTGSYARQQGSHDVRVGIIDTGVDGSHPDIAPNFDKALSRNFTVDNPPTRHRRRPVRGPVCVDPVDEDDDGHGTHVAGTDRRGAERHRRRRRRAGRRPREHPRRPGLGLLPAPADRRRAHVRRATTASTS